jgi:hypothetical protein
MALGDMPLMESLEEPRKASKGGLGGGKTLSFRRGSLMIGNRHGEGDRNLA